METEARENKMNLEALYQKAAEAEGYERRENGQIYHESDDNKTMFDGWMTWQACCEDNSIDLAA